MSGTDNPGSGTPGEVPDLDGPNADAAAADSSGADSAAFHSQAYSAPESEQFTSPYVPYDEYDTELVDGDEPPPPRWPWVVGVAAIIAAITLVASVALLVAGRSDETTGAAKSTSVTPTPSTTPWNEIITTTTPPPPPPPTTTTPAQPRQITYAVTGSKAPLDRITITYIDPQGRTRVAPNAYIPWSITVTPISNSEIGSVSASSMLRLSQLNCTITTSDGQVLSSNNNNSAQATC
ncbi:MmpS family transport accessory protein [Mycobacterium sp. D16Q13]|uniref:MmpS family transport accessory protein n=1 Tax=Mycobacterium sp. D16Q13 TaxID=1855657 RepID=UPI000993CA56|nr:MmpS family transport accessory protein [Mycobacterium sp. D16Q13]